MAQLRGKAKEEFLRRMARGRCKAAKKNPRKAAAKKKASKKTARKNGKKKNSKLTGKKKAEFLKRMAKGRRAAARAGNPKKKPAGKRRGRRNPEDSIEAAAAKFEEFHGKPPGRVVEYEAGYNYPSNFAEMGKLKELQVALDSANPDFPLTNFKGTQAVCTPDGHNIYFIGGDQSIDFEALGISSSKDMVELGPCVYICYHTVKGFHDFEPIDYEHEFGEENGVYPVLAYDRLNKNLFLLGGDYQVRPEGITN